MPAGMHQAGVRAARARKRKEALRKAEDARAGGIEEECHQVFTDADADSSGVLEPEEVRALILKLTGESAITDSVYKHLVGYATDHFPGSLDAHILRPQLPKLLSASRAYVEQSSLVDSLLTKHDDDGSGVLELKEFVNALVDVTPGGMKVRAGDVLWLLSKCDLDGDRKLTFAELLPAIGLLVAESQELGKRT